MIQLEQLKARRKKEEKRGKKNKVLYYYQFFRDLWQSNPSRTYVVGFFIRHFRILQKRIFQNSNYLIPINIKNYPNSHDIHIAIRLTGGIGDAICQLRWVKALQKKQPYLKIDCYFAGHKNINKITEACHIHMLFADTDLALVAPYYDISLMLNHRINVLEYHDRNKKRFKEIKTFLTHSQAKIDDYVIYNDKFNCGLDFDRIIAQGYNRNDFLIKVSGLELTDYRIPVQFDKNLTDIHPDLQAKKYITLHDGWDTQLNLGYCTKRYPATHWQELINLLKVHRPHIMLVQIGGTNGCDYQGTDINLRNKTSFDDAMLILKHSILHIDIDSGLVHLAAALGVKSLVLFGPSNASYFSYPDNINLQAQPCHECDFLTNFWMEICPLGKKQLDCMPSIKPLIVAEKVTDFIKTV